MAASSPPPRTGAPAALREPASGVFVRAARPLHHAVQGHVVHYDDSSHFGLLWLVRRLCAPGWWQEAGRWPLHTLYTNGKSEIDTRPQAGQETIQPGVENDYRRRTRVDVDVAEAGSRRSQPRGYIAGGPGPIAPAHQRRSSPQRRLTTRKCPHIWRQSGDLVARRSGYRHFLQPGHATVPSCRRKLHRFPGWLGLAAPDRRRRLMPGDLRGRLPPATCAGAVLDDIGGG